MAAMGRNRRVIAASVAARGSRHEAALASAADQRQVEQHNHEHGQDEKTRTGSSHGEIK
jgi:hypothetical protein